jgi:hypothetical protein
VGRPDAKAAFRRPAASAAVEGMTTSTPGKCAAADSSVCE